MFEKEKYLGLIGRPFTLLALLFFSAFSFAQKNVTLRDAIEKAALTNPGVQASWHAFEAAHHGVRTAKGGYFPRLDLTAERGRERVEDPLGVEDTYDIESYRLTLTQMLFDGFATKNEVDRQNYTKLVRYYEFKQASEEMALETAQAYFDVVRLRELVALAKENYQQHRRYHDDIEERVASGIGRGVDLEQARARLALAESNVLTETTNLHDVSSRYLRLVGQLPAALMHTPVLAEGLIPAQRIEALEQAFISNPELNAAIENIRTTRADYRGRKASMMPRLDLRLRKQLDENERGIPGQYDEEAVELVLTYNLYNGGSDSAARRQSKYLMFEATDTRDRICREVRQTVSIAHNDIASQQRLIVFLERNVDAISKARQAYKNQFDIGQRTLLDLLDTENEYFEVKRTLVNAKNELLLAQIRTLAGMGLLLKSLNVDSLSKDADESLDLEREEELKARCPAEAPEMLSLIGSAESKKVVDRASSGFSLAEIIVQESPLEEESALEEEGTTLSSNKELMRLDVKFANQSADLTAGSDSEISRVAAFLCENTTIFAAVQGHTDSLGSEAFNLQLSQDRAASVRDALIRECSDADDRLSAVGFGESRPIANNDSVQGRAENRRVELMLESSDIVDEQSANGDSEVPADEREAGSEQDGILSEMGVDEQTLEVTKPKISAPKLDFSMPDVRD